MLNIFFQKIPLFQKCKLMFAWFFHAFSGKNFDSKYYLLSYYIKRAEFHLNVSFIYSISGDFILFLYFQECQSFFVEVAQFFICFFYIKNFVAYALFPLFNGILNKKRKSTYLFSRVREVEAGRCSASFANPSLAFRIEI